jgi:preprotein translocase subunit SecA
MNQQREVIYQYRRNVLKGYNLNLEILDMVKDTLAMTIEEIYGNLVYEEDWNLEYICSWIKNNLNVLLEPSQLETGRRDLAALQDVVEEKVLGAYQQREAEMGSEQMRELERRALLSVVDENWREHLREMDLMKEGIGLRAYGQKDPLIEYKKESFNLFQELVATINKEVTRKVFTAYIITPDNIQEYLRHANLSHSEVSAFAKAAGSGASQPKQQGKEQKPVRKPRTVEHKVGRNDPCPCGSGKKYKKCCGKPQNN